MNAPNLKSNWEINAAVRFYWLSHYIERRVEHRIFCEKMGFYFSFKSFDEWIANGFSNF